MKISKMLNAQNQIITRFISIALWSLLLTVGIVAQPLKITTVIQPPYPLQVEDYILQKNTKAFIIVTNTSQTTQQFRLESTVEGNNGVKSALKPGYKPLQAIAIAPNESKTLNYAQLQPLYSNMTQSNIQTEGIDPQVLVQTGMLPEGTYTICVKAYGFNDNTLLSTGGCTTIYLSHFDPPIVIKPSTNEEIKALQPQFLNINWTVAGVPGTTKYKVKIIDATLYNSLNINELVSSPAVVPLYQTDNLAMTTLVYDATKPTLIDGHKYIVQVTAYDPLKKLAFKNEGKSVPILFTYKKMGIIQNPNDNGGGGVVKVNPKIVINPNQNQPQFQIDNDPPDCIANACELVSEPAKTGNYLAKVTDEIKVGKFKMKVTSATNNIGEGTIIVPFLKTPIKVKFSNIKINNDKQVYEGTVTGVIDNQLIVDESMTALDANLEDKVGKEKAKQINEFVNNASRKVSKMNGQTPIGLPIALDNLGYNLAIVGINFTPKVAYMNAVLGVEWLESIDNDWVTFAQSKICIRPNGLGAEVQIGLKNDKILKVSNEMNLKFNGNNQTYIAIDCKGFKKLQIAGTVEFSNKLAIPVNAQGQAIANAKLNAALTISTSDIRNWTVENATLSAAFKIPLAPNFIFNASGLTFDHSDFNSPTNLNQTFDFLSLVGDQNRKKWKGLYLKNLTCKLPDAFKNNGQVIEIAVNDLLIDKNGFSGKIEPKNFNIGIDKGDVSGWAFSVESFKVGFKNSKLQSGGFGGAIRLPIAETSIGYNCVVDAGDGKFQFSLTNKDAFESKMWFANITVESSTITIDKDQNNKFFAAADINGNIAIKWGDDTQYKQGEEKPKTASFALPTIDFDHLKLSTKSLKAFSIGAIQLDNPMKDQGNMAAFPFKLNGIGFEKKADGQDSLVGIKLNLGLTLAECANGISGSTDFTVFAKYSNEKRFKFHSTKINTITIKAALTVADITGSLDIYDQDATYGNGFRGAISAHIKGIGIGVAAALQVGRTLDVKKDGKVTSTGYNYFMFDAMVKKDDGIIIPGTAAAIYALGGGFWWNMTQQALPAVKTFDGFSDKKEVSNTVGATQSGIVYTPNEGKFGFKASVAFGIAKVSSVVNGDVTFQIHLNNSNGFDSLILSGNVYVMQSFGNAADRKKASIQGFMSLKIAHQPAAINIDNNPNNNNVAADYVIFHLQAGITANVADILKGSVNLAMHFEPNKWYINCGKWNTGKEYYQDIGINGRNKLEIDLKVGPKISFYCYMMMGSTIPGLPELPKVIKEAVGGDPNNPKTGAQAAAEKNQKDAALKQQCQGADPDGKGFAFGAVFDVSVNPSFIFFYADIDIVAGFDVLLKQYGEEVTCNGNSDFGIKKWYAKGQAYVYLHAEAGVQLDLWFYKSKKWPIVSLTTAAVLQAQLPNPNWVKGDFVIKGEVLNGLIDFHTHFQFEVGEKCVFNQTNPFSDYPIISEVKPQTGDKMEVYENFSIACNYDKNGFEIVEIDENNPEKSKKRHFGFKNMQFSLIKKSNKAVVETQPLQWAFNGRDATVAPKEQLLGETEYQYRVSVEGWDLDKKVKIYDEKYPSDKDMTVKTGKLPDHLPSAVLLSASPSINQRFFLKNESTKGEIVLKDGSNYCYLLKAQDIQTSGKGMVRLTELATNKRFEIECQCSGDKFSYDLPKELANSKIYKVELFRREIKLTNFTTPEKSGGYGWGGGDSNGNTYSSEDYQNVYNQYLSTKEGKANAAKVEGDNKKLNVLLQNRAKKKNNYIDKVVMTYYFKTSKFNTFNEKIATFKQDKTAQKRISVYNNGLADYDDWYSSQGTADGAKIDGIEYGFTHIYLPVTFFKFEENFDQYDAYGYALNNKAQIAVVPPLFELVKPKNQWYNTYYQEHIYNYPLAIQQYLPSLEDVNRHEGHPIWGNTTLPLGSERKNSNVNSYLVEFYKKAKHGYWNLHQMDMDGKTLQEPAPPLSQNEVEKEAAKYQPSNGNTLNQFAINQQGGGMQQNVLNLDIQQDMSNYRIAVIEYDRWLSFRDMDRRLSYGLKKAFDAWDIAEEADKDSATYKNGKKLWQTWVDYDKKECETPDRFIPNGTHRFVLRWYNNDAKAKNIDYQWKRNPKDETQEY